MNKVRAALLCILTICGSAGIASPASADDDSPCPAKLAYFLSLYINNGLNEWAFQEWFENSELILTEGSGPAAECHYVGARWTSDPYAELQDPKYHWHASYAVIAAQSQ